jgi:hypothetical protein
MSCPVMHNCGNVPPIFRADFVVTALTGVDAIRAPRTSGGAARLLPSGAVSRSPLSGNAA